MLLTQSDKNQILSNPTFNITHFHISSNYILSDPQNEIWLKNNFNTVESEFKIHNTTILKCSNVKSIWIDNTKIINPSIIPITPIDHIIKFNVDINYWLNYNYNITCTNPKNQREESLFLLYDRFLYNVISYPSDPFALSWNMIYIEQSLSIPNVILK